jgi:uncharacterized protein YdhG (YjbR/CyaY superfamily)
VERVFENIAAIIDFMKTTRFKTIDAYIAAQPVSVRTSLKELRNAIHTSAPDATEVISCNMPAYKFHGMLVYFADHKEHIGFYPFSSAIRAFTHELKKYETSKGTVKFPHGKKIPSALVKKMVKFRVNENLQKAHARISSKTS